MVNEMDVDMDIDLGLTDDLAVQEIDIDLSVIEPLVFKFEADVL